VPAGKKYIAEGGLLWASTRAASTRARPRAKVEIEIAPNIRRRDRCRRSTGVARARAQNWKHGLLFLDGRARFAFPSVPARQRMSRSSMRSAGSSIKRPIKGAGGTGGAGCQRPRSRRRCSIRLSTPLERFARFTARNSRRRAFFAGKKKKRNRGPPPPPANEDAQAWPQKSPPDIDAPQMRAGMPGQGRMRSRDRGRRRTRGIWSGEKAAATASRRKRQAALDAHDRALGDPRSSKPTPRRGPRMAPLPGGPRRCAPRTRPVRGGDQAPPATDVACGREILWSAEWHDDRSAAENSIGASGTGRPPCCDRSNAPPSAMRFAAAFREWCR